MYCCVSGQMILLSLIVLSYFVICVFIFQYGGPRFVTFMIYLSNVESGGHTVFCSLGLNVKPKAGDALFWFNLDSAGDYDTRNMHLGCPVIYGN